jgi:hypothetical protein
MESMHHLIIKCPFSRHVWHEVLAWARMTCAPPSTEPSLFDGNEKKAHLSCASYPLDDLEASERLHLQ